MLNFCFYVFSHPRWVSIIKSNYFVWYKIQKNINVLICWWTSLLRNRFCQFIYMRSCLIDSRPYSRNKRQHPVGFKKGTFLQATMVENVTSKILSDGWKQHPKTLKCLFLINTLWLKQQYFGVWKTQNNTFKPLV